MIEQIMQGVVSEIVFPLLTQVVLPMIGGWAAVKIGKAIIHLIETKAGIDLSEATEAFIEDTCFKVVKAVEEYAKTKVDGKGKKLGGEAKLADAYKKVEAKLAKEGIDIDEDEILDTIHHCLDTLRTEKVANGGGTAGESS